LEIIRTSPGIQAKNIPQLLGNRPLKKIERQIGELIKLKKIERRGSKKTGGYYLKV
jgi:ATP-dependent DNA helicase RecG